MEGTSGKVTSFEKRRIAPVSGEAVRSTSDGTAVATDNLESMSGVVRDSQEPSRNHVLREGDDFI
jgi:hypothetical protein